MLQIVARNERIRGMISQLLGPWEGISEPGTRGLYCTRPCYRKSGERIPPELIEPRVDSDNKGGPAAQNSPATCEQTRAQARSPASAGSQRVGFFVSRPQAHLHAPLSPEGSSRSPSSAPSGLLPPPAVLGGRAAAAGQPPPVTAQSASLCIGHF